MEIVILLFATTIVVLSTFLQYRKINQLSNLLKNKQVSPHNSYVSTPNSLPEEDQNLIDLNEEVIHVPPEVKIEVEGGELGAVPMGGVVSNRLATS